MSVFGSAPATSHDMVTVVVENIPAITPVEVVSVPWLAVAAKRVEDDQTLPSRD